MTVLHRLSKHLEFRPTHSAARPLSSRCLDIPMKNYLSCLKHFVNFLAYSLGYFLSSVRDNKSTGDRAIACVLLLIVQRTYFNAGVDKRRIASKFN